MEADMNRLINLDTDLVRTFVTVADMRSFTRAGARLGRSQSAISLQIRRLEDRLGRALLSRDPRHVVLTPAGEDLLPQARQLLRLNDEMVAGLNDDDIEGEVRLGAPEDFATVHLPEILGLFARTHPKVALSVTCDLTLNLLDRLKEGDLDIALVKREPLGPELGVRVWREALVWVAADPGLASPGQTLALIAAPSPCVYRKRAISTLEAAGRPWRLAYTSPSLAGQHAALRAGLGITVLPRDMVPADLAIIGEATGLPKLAEAEVALLKARTAISSAAERLASDILSALDRRHAQATERHLEP